MVRSLRLFFAMSNRPIAPYRDRTMSFVRVIRGFAEASVAALVFAFAILLIGIPIALIVRGLHEGLSWLVRLGSEMSGLTEPLVAVSSVAGGLGIALLVAPLVV